MNYFLKIFNEPYPLEDDNRIRLLYNFLISCAVVILLVIIKPFGLDQINYQMAKQLPVYLGFGSVTFLICLMADFLIKPAFPVFFDEQRWTVGKNIFWVVFIIVFIGVGNLFFSNALGYTGVSGSSLLRFQFEVMMIVVLPATILTLVTKSSLLKSNVKQVKDVNALLERAHNPAISHVNLLFTSENGDELIKLNSDQLLYVESADNYSDIVYTENSIVKRELIKSSLKRIEESNSDEFVVRTHRNYLVNLRKVHAVTGNAQGCRLMFKMVEESVPVAKRASEKVRGLIGKIHG